MVGLVTPKWIGGGLTKEIAQSVLGATGVGTLARHFSSDSSAEAPSSAAATSASVSGICGQRNRFEGCDSRGASPRYDEQRSVARVARNPAAGLRSYAASNLSTNHHTLSRSCARRRSAARRHGAPRMLRFPGVHRAQFASFARAVESARQFAAAVSIIFGPQSLYPSDRQTQLQKRSQRT